MAWIWKVIIENCTGCGVCADVCPDRAIRMTRDMPYPEEIPGQCQGCLTCMNECPFDAVEVRETEQRPENSI